MTVSKSREGSIVEERIDAYQAQYDITLHLFSLIRFAGY